ncbi:MAG TPA: lipid IV(A) 3-deoxy-D-manno-octulosonic acid transferase [Burkholderiales bacterium]|nr:lipid IV(A) 3-deoxy-D-manno-octulosonic acid transferase [Burkholderiales bacterium]
MRRLYSALLALSMPLILLRLWWRGRREPGYRRNVAERLGRYDVPAAEKLVWVHAVSVGEARAAAPLVRALQGALPGHRILMTCTTAAGRDTLRQVYGDSVQASFVPYDLPSAVERFLRHFRPRLGVLMETEVWPNLIGACAAAGIPLVLANARMSEKSARGYARLSRLTRPAFSALTAVGAQSSADAERLRSLGAARVQVSGNLKFDAAPNPAQLAAGRAWREALGRPVLLLASTREGEEHMLLKEAGDISSDTLIVVVPRHPQRFDEVAGLAQSRRTRNPVPAATDRVYLGDTMGEMAFYYAAADVAVIGGSFLPLGGQNLIESLASGTPVILGPHMFNFAEATELAVAAGAALQVESPETALIAAAALLQDVNRRRTMSDAGRKFCEMHRGAAERQLAVCLEALEKNVVRP